jgi:hypothetical protein
MAIIRKTALSPIPQIERVLSWILRSRLRSATAVLVFGASASLLECMIHLAVTKTSGVSPLLQAFADSMILGVIAAFFGMLVLKAALDRREKLRDDLRRIAELNHQVRNSLQIIVYGERSADLAERRSAVLEGVEKIEGTLRELFPLIGDRRNDERPWEAHNQLRLQEYKFLRERRAQPTQLRSKSL